MRMLKQRGVDMIKTQSLIPKDAYFALADEAARSAFPSRDMCRTRSPAWKRYRASTQLRALIGVTRHEQHADRGLATNNVWQCPTVINSVGTAADFTDDPGLPFWLRPAVEGWRRTAVTRARKRRLRRARVRRARHAQARSHQDAV